MDFPKYTEIDGKAHLIVEGEHTECGLVIPHGNGWVKEPEGKVHCGKKPEAPVLDQRDLPEPESPLAAPEPKKK